jgi:hypothetical protein
MTQSEFEKLEKDVIVNVNNYVWNDSKTDYTYKYNGLNRTLFAIASKKKILIILNDGSLSEINKTSDNSYSNAYTILKKRIEQLNADKNSLQQSNENKTDEIESPNKLTKQNIEKIDNKYLLDKITIEKQKAKLLIENAKPNFTVKIPKALAKGYFNLDLSNFLKGLTGGMSTFAIGLLMSKITSNLSELLSSNLNDDKNISASKIESNLNSINLSELIQETIEEENLMKTNTIINTVTTISGTTISSVSGNTNDIIYDTSSNLNETGNYIDNSLDVKLNITLDTENKNKITIKNKNKEKYSVNQRNREDLLNSSIVEERLNSIQQAQEIIYNPNYGKYLK